MGWFSPVKGSYPSLAQIDKTLPVKGGVATIERGTIVALEADGNGNSAEGVWDLAGATDKLLYIALQDYSDPTAGFAGSAFDPKGGVPRITAISLDMDGEYETSVFDKTASYAPGDALKVVNGTLTKSTSDSDVIVGYATSAHDPSDPRKSERYVNDAIAVPSNGTDRRLALRTGANLNVLRFRTK